VNPLVWWISVGATTEFQLIAAGNDGELSLNRVAVGEHILLGRDNVDHRASAGRWWPTGWGPRMARKIASRQHLGSFGRLPRAKEKLL